MLKKILLIISLIVSIPILLVFALFVWSKMAEADSKEALDYVTKYFQGYKGVELVNILDLNEEFPSCCPEIMVEYKFKKQTLIIDNLNIDTFEKQKPFRLSGINDGYIKCRSSNGYFVHGIDAYSFPDKVYQALEIKSVDDLVVKHDRLVAYFSSWPTSAKGGIEVKSGYDGSQLSCYRSISSDCD